MNHRTEAEKMYQAAVRCVGEGGSVRGGPRRNSQELANRNPRTIRPRRRRTQSGNSRTPGKIVPLTIAPFRRPRKYKRDNAMTSQQFYEPGRYRCCPRRKKISVTTSRVN